MYINFVIFLIAIFFIPFFPPLFEFFLNILFLLYFQISPKLTSEIAQSYIPLNREHSAKQVD